MKESIEIEMKGEKGTIGTMIVEPMLIENDAEVEVLKIAVLIADPTRMKMID